MELLQNFGFNESNVAYVTSSSDAQFKIKESSDPYDIVVMGDYFDPHNTERVEKDDVPKALSNVDTALNLITAMLNKDKNKNIVLLSNYFKGRNVNGENLRLNDRDHRIALTLDNLLSKFDKRKDSVRGVDTSKPYWYKTDLRSALESLGFELELEL